MPAAPLPTHLLFALMGALTAAGTAAQDKLPPIDPALRARFGFVDPLIKKLGPGTNLVRTVQWGENTETHLLVHNPHRARLEDLLLQDDGFQSEHISTQGDITGLATSDVNQDGRQDILTLTNRGRLAIDLRGVDETLPEIEVGQAAILDCLRVGDIDGDGRVDAMVLTREGLRTVTKLGANPEVSSAVSVFGPRLQSFYLLDFDQDGDLDVLVCAQTERMQLHLKLGDGRGGFGPWVLLDTPRLLGVFPGTNHGGAPTLAAIHLRPRRVVEYELRRTDDGQRPAMLITALSPTTKPRAFAHGDVDSDGDPDLVVSDPERAQLTFLLEEDGQFGERTAPTLAGVQSMAIGDINGDNRNDLVIVSTEEQSLAWVDGTTPLGSFPKPLGSLPNLDGKPAIPVAVTLQGPNVLVLLRDSKKNASLHRVRVGVDQPAELLVELGNLRRDPLRLLSADLDGRFGADLAYVVPGGGLVVLLADEEGRFVKSAGSAAAGFTKRMEDGSLSVTGLGAESALLVVRERYARSFRYDAEGQPAILSQDNGPEGNPSLAMGTILADGTRLYLDRQANRLFRMAPDKPTISVDVPPISPTYLLGHGRDILVLGRDGVLRIPSKTGFELHTAREHEPPTPRTDYYGGIAADLDHDGELELALLDSSINGLHLLVPQGDKLRRGLTFPIFEATESGIREPHGIAAGDVDGDGRTDLVFLSHDRILLYKQER